MGGIESACSAGSAVVGSAEKRRGPSDEANATIVGDEYVTRIAQGQAGRETERSVYAGAVSKHPAAAITAIIATHTAHKR
jgi:hypothetical protein